MTKPTVHHGAPVRGNDVAPGSVLQAGRFGRIFRALPVYDHPEFASQLASIAAAMLDPGDEGDFAPVPDPEPPDANENPILPAGYTYFGQFIDHDITFDPVSSLQHQNDPDALHDFRTPRFDLDNVYGRGPDDQPYLYVSGAAPVPHPTLGFDTRGVMLRLGQQVSTSTPLAAGPDLPRTDDGRAIIGDPRNDENLIVSQLQSVMMQFHNKVVEHVVQQDSTLEGGALFKRAQQEVIWHYQWLVINDFLRRIVDGTPLASADAATSVVDDVLNLKTFSLTNGPNGLVYRPSLQLYSYKNQPFIPVEFSVACYRFGHSMVRPSYFINDVVKASKGGARIPLFSLDGDPLANLNGFRVLPPEWGIDWKYFFEVEPGFKPQHGYKIDHLISNPLGQLPADTDHRSLALLNLLRGERMSLPSGQTVARAMGIPALSDVDLDLPSDATDYAGDAPLWFYVLKEAELLSASTHLGPVGGRIVAEVFVGLLAGDPLSFINIAPGWKPTLGDGADFTMADLIRFVQPRPAMTPAPQPGPTYSSE